MNGMDPPDADVDGLDAVALVQRLARGGDGPAAGVDEERVAVVLVAERQLRAERGVSAQVRLDARRRRRARVWPGATRALITTAISGLSVLEAFATLGASMPVTVMRRLVPDAAEDRARCRSG